MKNIKRAILFVCAIFFLLALSLTLISEAMADEAKVPGDYPATQLLTAKSDVLGNMIEYPDCKPLIKSMIITMAPGQTGKVHQHLTPLYAYMLSGKIKVSYQDEAHTTNIYVAGDAIIEAMHLDHHGFNPFDEPASLLAVFMECQAE